MKNIHLFAYYWPPASSPGVQRWLKLTKYLSRLDNNITVITTKNGSYPNFDESLSTEIVSNIKTIRTNTLEPFYIFNLLRGKKSLGNKISVGMDEIKGKETLFKRISSIIRANIFIPDARVLWVIFAIIKYVQLEIKKPADIIITTGPPHSSHLIGLALKYIFKKKWIADFRDPWTTIYYNETLPKYRFIKKLEYKLESLIIAKSDHIVTVTKGIFDEFRDRSNKISIINNGFDEDDFFYQNIDKNKKFTISYFGNLMSNQHIPIFWNTLSKIVESNTIDIHDLYINLVGNINEQTKTLVENSELKTCTQILPFIPHIQAKKGMYNSDLLLLIIPNTSGNDSIVTGKIYDYIGSTTPILCIGPTQGNANEILLDCDYPGVIDYNDDMEIKNRLISTYITWKNSKNPQKINTTKRLKYSRQNQAIKFNTILNSMR